MRDFINYNQALELKELGFDEPCFAKYYQQDGNTPFIQIGEAEIEEAENGGDDITFECNAPLFQQAFRFFRDKKLSDSCICRYQGRNDGGIYYYYVINHDFGIEETKHYKEGFLSYEEAESACLDKLIEIAKKNNYE